MSDNDKKLREMIIEKFMSKNKSNVVLDKIESKEETTINDVDNIDNIDNIEDYSDIDEEIETDENYNYLNDEELNKDFVFDNETIGSSSIAICLYRLNSDSEYPFLEFYCKKENAIYDFPSRTIDIIDGKE